MTKRWYEFAPVPVRMIVGGGLAYHGYPKLFTVDGHLSFLHIMQEMGVPFAEAASWLIAVLEFGGGLALFTGTFVVTVALLIVIEMTINLVSALVNGGFPPPLNPNQPLPGYEQTLLYLFGALALWLGGSGAVSITRMFVPRPTE
ncbi:MAG TPA: DoxX family protein [Rhizomicrobium sp.]